MKNILSSALFLLVFASCSLLWEYREIHEIDGMQWKQSDVQTFNYSTNKDVELDVILMIRHVYGFAYSTLPIELTIKQNGETLLTETKDIQVKNEDDEYVGEGSVDLWDLHNRILTKQSLPSGGYTIEVRHTAKQEVFPLIMEVGIQLEKSETKKGHTAP